jgi:hypothetical protein
MTTTDHHATAAAELAAHLATAAAELSAAYHLVTARGIPNVRVLDAQITAARLAVDTAAALVTPQIPEGDE